MMGNLERRPGREIPPEQLRRLKCHCGSEEFEECPVVYIDIDVLDKVKHAAAVSIPKTPLLRCFNCKARVVPPEGGKGWRVVPKVEFHD